jgi:acetolactate decarboxylase
MNKSWNQTDKNRIGKILGFYSIKHHAIFTHHSTNSHMHYLDGKSGLSGHVDDLVLGENVILRLPK